MPVPGRVQGHDLLAHRSGLYVQAHEVHENDEFDVEYGLEPKLVHKPVFKDRGSVVAYYGVWKDKDGISGFEIMSKEDVEAHARKYSQSYGKGFSPWKTNFDEMAKKTVIKKALKYAPLTTEFIRGVTADGTIKTALSQNMADVSDETDYTDIEAEPVPDNVDPATGKSKLTRQIRKNRTMPSLKHRSICKNDGPTGRAAGPHMR